MEINVENIDSQLQRARDNGENLAELMALFDYFIKYTPEGRQVSREIEQDWQETCQVLRDSKRLVGADFTLYGWLQQIRKELLADARPAQPARKPKSKPVRAAKKPLRFKGIER